MYKDHRKVQRASALKWALKGLVRLPSVENMYKGQRKFLRSGEGA